MGSKNVQLCKEEKCKYIQLLIYEEMSWTFITPYLVISQSNKIFLMPLSHILSPSKRPQCIKADRFV